MLVVRNKGLFVLCFLLSVLSCFRRKYAANPLRLQIREKSFPFLLKPLHRLLERAYWLLEAFCGSFFELDLDFLELLPDHVVLIAAVPKNFLVLFHFIEVPLLNKTVHWNYPLTLPIMVTQHVC